MGKLKQWRRSASEVIFDAAWQCSAAALTHRGRRALKAIAAAADGISRRIRRIGAHVRGCGCIHVEAEGCHGEWCECACHPENDRG